MNGAVIATLAGLLLGSPQDARDESIERQVRSLTQSLGLSEAQAENVRTILKKRSDELSGVLTEEQRERYESLSRGRSSRGRRNRGWWPSTEDLKQQLSLSDEQAAGIAKIRESIRDAFRTFWQDRRGSNNSREEWDAFQKKLREENTAKIRGLLDEEQKAGFDKLMAEYSAVSTDPRGRGERNASPESRIDRVMELLRIENADEAAAIRSLVARVIEIMGRTGEAQREARVQFERASRDEALSDASVGEKIVEIRKGLRKLEKELAAARQSLAEVLTNRQELELLRRGLLR